MTVLTVKSIVRSGIGIIKDDQGNQLTVKVFKPKGLLNFRCHVEGVDKGFQELNAESMWQIIIDMYSVKEIDIKEKNSKKTKNI
jgi:hypothetical protein